MLSRELKISTKKNSREDTVDYSWFLVAMIVPEIALVAGLYFAWKGKKNAWTIVFISICFSIAGYILLVVVYTNLF